MTKRIIVTGGAGFIGANTVARLLADGWRVLVLDNLSRPGAKQNLDWLQNLGDFDFEKVNLADADATKEAVTAFGKTSAVIHLAGQVAVTTSLIDPRDDFRSNALGTFNLLEAVRASGHRPMVLFSSTNKVYGGLEWVELREDETRWTCTSHPMGISEIAPLDFHSPYGCSKGAADQYVRDYSRCYGIPTVVLRQSCILGPRQFGVEDQGWVAWFLIAAMLGRPVTVFGDGKQVRDLLWVEDLVDLYLRIIEAGAEMGGEIFNAGGGAGNTLSLVELLEKIAALRGEALAHAKAEPRAGDQRWFVADTTHAAERIHWRPNTGVDQAIETLWRWIHENRSVIESAISRLQTQGK